MLKRIMVRAHQIAKGMEGDYQARLVLALRQAWREEKKEMSNTVTRKSLTGLKKEDYTGAYFTMDSVWEIWYLPELEGTEKQIKWANSIRSDFVRSANKGVEKAEDKFGVSKEDFLSKIEATLNEQTTAKFWIDNRNKI